MFKRCSYSYDCIFCYSSCPYFTLLYFILILLYFTLILHARILKLYILHIPYNTETDLNKSAFIKIL
jgi:hypothetical protein